MNHILHRINVMNTIPKDVQSSLIHFVVDNRVLGKVTPQIAQLLVNSSCDDNHGIFELVTAESDDSDNKDRSTMLLTLGRAAGTTFEERTNSVSKITTNLHNRGYITGWRNELYPVSDSFDNSKQQPPLFLIERAAVPILGILEYGVHINGLVTTSCNDENNNDDESSTLSTAATTTTTTRMWMARRSKTKSKYPGYVDHIVAGGQPHGLTLMENVLKECREEAGIAEDVARRGIRPAGAVSYEQYSLDCGIADEREGGLGVIHRVVLFCFDLHLPHDFRPTAVDGEVESFFTWSMEDIVEAMDPECTDPIKPNCYLGESLRFSTTFYKV